ncbi:MAG: hypothetical protein OEX22_09535 [Cyclobacteriaceae bacterium]|nr:hypothetical protein [Cyclobacteriaceae bacterium]
MKTIKNILLSLLIANTLGSALFVPLIYLDYSVRKDYIAKVLCINKDKPMLNCNGKCILAQKIKKAQEQEDESKDITQKLEISFFFAKWLQYEMKNFYTERENTTSLYMIINLPEGHFQGVFHPPQG